MFAYNFKAVPKEIEMPGTDNNDQNSQKQNTDNTQTTENNGGPAGTTVDIDKIVAEKVAESLKDIKGKLDNAYAARDEALSKIRKFEEEKRAAEIQALRDAGKHQEAFEAKEAGIS